MLVGLVHIFVIAAAIIMIIAVVAGLAILVNLAVWTVRGKPHPSRSDTP